jgi:hypothetical protein
MSTIYTYFLRKCITSGQNRTVGSHINLQLKIEIGGLILNIFIVLSTCNQTLFVKKICISNFNVYYVDLLFFVN